MTARQVDDQRPDPDALLARLDEERARAERGQLKIFFGASPGVGKTYAMLAEAQRLREQGRDVVVGVVETHGRTDTQRLLSGLDVLPRKRIDYLDLVPPALDVDAATGPGAVEYQVLDVARGPRERLLAAFDGADTVLHLAWSHAEPGVQASPNLDSLRRVLEVADETGIHTLVHLSSSTVYGAWPDNPVPLPEEAALRPNPGFGFAVEKAEAERMIAEWADSHPTVVVAVLRPAVTIGTATVTGSAGAALNQALAGTRGPRPDDGGRPLQFLHVDDLAAAVVAAPEKGLRGVYNVAPDGWITEDDARTLAGGVARVTLPGRLARLLARLGWDLLRTGTPKEALPYSLHPWVVANDRLRAAGWAPEYSNEEALVQSDERLHWGDLPPSRRQKLTLLGASLMLIVTAGAAAAGAASLLARARRARLARATKTG